MSWCLRSHQVLQDRCHSYWSYAYHCHQDLNFVIGKDTKNENSPLRMQYYLCRTEVLGRSKNLYLI